MPKQPPAPESNIEEIKDWVFANRKVVVWTILGLLVGWLLLLVKEITTLLFLSYVIAILLDPIVTRLEKKGVSRSISILGIGCIVFAGVLVFALVVVPAIVDQYSDLIVNMPLYITTAAKSTQEWLHRKLHIPTMTIDQFWMDLKEYSSTVTTDSVKTVGSTLFETLLKGYSFTLTIFNLILLPFFVFYMTRDLKLIHRSILGFLNRQMAGEARMMGREILVHIYAFVQGQLTVSLILALIYAAGLSLVGLPSGIAVGLLTGVLNVVPYVGVGCGLLLATLITIVSNPTMGQFFLVWGVFAIALATDSALLTPRIIGNKVGIHPLVVMVCLIIGGQLLGLLGLIIAIPVAASLRVLYKHLIHALDEAEVA